VSIERHDAARLAALREIVGSHLDDAAGDEVLRAARAYDHVALRQLDEDLVARPRGLRSRVADGPWVTVRVAHALAGQSSRGSWAPLLGLRAGDSRPAAADAAGTLLQLVRDAPSSAGMCPLPAAGSSGRLTFGRRDLPALLKH
jgi:hypothetical protein